jgi:hypothetical protein
MLAHTILTFRAQGASEGRKIIMSKSDDLISRQAAIDEIGEWIKAFLENEHKESAADACLIQDGIIQLPSAQPEEVIPHRNYKYLSDYWCACGWHLGKKGDVKYCADCGRKVNWDG